VLCRVGTAVVLLFGNKSSGPHVTVNVAKFNLLHRKSPIAHATPRWDGPGTSQYLRFRQLKRIHGIEVTTFSAYRWPGGDPRAGLGPSTASLRRVNRGPRSASNGRYTHAFPPELRPIAGGSSCDCGVSYPPFRSANCAGSKRITFGFQGEIRPFRCRVRRRFGAGFRQPSRDFRHRYRPAKLEFALWVAGGPP
jgi:hypothetical protein